MKTFSIIFVVMLLMAGCQSTPQDFSLFFTLESVDTYTLSLEIQKDKFYHIRQQNLYLDKNAGQEHQNTSQGIMTAEEFAQLQELIANCRIFNMKDAYGFDKKSDERDPLSDMFYQLNYTERGKNKFITIHLNSNGQYPEPLLQLIKFLSQYASQKLVKAA